MLEIVDCNNMSNTIIAAYFRSMIMQYWHLISSWYQTSILPNFPNLQRWIFDVVRTFSTNIALTFYVGICRLKQYVKLNHGRILKTYVTAELTSHFAVISNFNVAKFSKSATLDFRCCKKLFNPHCPNILCRKMLLGMII